MHAAYTDDNASLNELPVNILLSPVPGAGLQSLEPLSCCCNILHTSSLGVIYHSVLTQQDGGDEADSVV